MTFERELANSPVAVQGSACTESPALPSSLPVVLTVDELAELLRVNHKTVRDAIARGEIPGVRRIGGTIRIHRDTVISWLASGQGNVSRSKRLR